MTNGSNVSRLIAGKKSDSGKYRTNIYVTREIYRKFQQVAEGMGLTITECFDSMMLDFIEANSPRPISSVPRLLTNTEEKE